MANLNLATQDWQIQFFRTGGVAIVAGYAYLDIIFWSATTRFYGYARLGGVATGGAWGGLGAADDTPWWKLSPDAGFSMNELHGAAGRAELDYGLGGNFDGVLKAWNQSNEWLFSGSGFTGRGRGSPVVYGAAHATIRGTWQFKESWAFED
jgi:hypothetical protein